MRGISFLFLYSTWIFGQDLVEKGIAEFHKGQYGAAIATLQEAPDGPYRRVFLALALVGTGRCDRAAGDLAVEFERNTDPELKRLSGLALVQCRRDQAWPVLARLQSLYPADPDVLYQAARLHMEAWNDAVYQMFQKTPASYRVNQISAEVFETQGRYAEAASEYRKAIEKNPAALNLHFRLGRALLLESHATENLAKARTEFETELALNPTDSVAEYQIGQLFMAEQKPAEAALRFERAVAQSPEFPEALQALAKCRSDQKRYPEAIRLLEKVVSLQPANEGARYGLMLAYRNAGRAEDATLQKAAIEKLQRAPEGEFTEFLKKLGEKAPKP
jgi:tetratricopeptide (TPR) repeat protein